MCGEQNSKGTQEKRPLAVRINADDFGWSRSCSEAIVECFEKGFITTTTACANGEYFLPAAENILTTEYKTCVGIHLNLTEGRALTPDIQNLPMFCDGDGNFNKAFSRTQPLSGAAKKAVYGELAAQVERFLDTGLTIHHADSHHHIHNAPNVFPIYMQVMRKYGIRQVRKFRNAGAISPVKRLVKGAYNRYLTKGGYDYVSHFGSFEDYRDGDYQGSFEIMVHPDYQGTRLVDREPGASYDAPYGTEMETIYREITGRKHEIVCESQRK